MIYKEKRLKILICLLIVFSFALSTSFSSPVFAGGIFGRGKTKASVEKKIETVEQKIDEERYRLRLNEAKQYLEKGDRYYVQDKLLEALAEWYTALALIEILRDAEFDSISDARIHLEREVKERLKADKSRLKPKDRKRLKRIEQAVEKVLKEQAQEETAKIKDKKEELVKASTREEEKKLSLEELETMKEGRKAIEEMISKQLISERKRGEGKETPVVEKVERALIAEVTIEEAPLRPKVEVEISGETIEEKTEDKALSRSEKRRAQARERRKQASLEKEKRIQEAREKAEEKRKARAEKVAMKKAHLEQKKKERQEALLAKKDAALKSKMEANLSKEMAVERKNGERLREKIGKSQKQMFKQRRHEDKIDEQLRDRAQVELDAKTEKDTKKSKALKAKFEKKQEKKLRLLEKRRQADIKRQLKRVERERRITEIKARKQAAKEKKQTVRSAAREGEKASFFQEEGPDRFDIIDRYLRRIEGFINIKKGIFGAEGGS